MKPIKDVMDIDGDDFLVRVSAVDAVRLRDRTRPSLGYWVYLAGGERMAVSREQGKAIIRHVLEEGVERLKPAFNNIYRALRKSAIANQPLSPDVIHAIFEFEGVNSLAELREKVEREESE